MITKHLQMSILSLTIVGVFLFAVSSQAQPAKGANKFLGNITTRGQIRSDFLKYWNQLTGENESKWSSIEGTRDRMNWGGTDAIANYAKQQGIPWKFHTLVWGSQFPNWINNLSQTDQLAEITEWFDAVAEKYPDVQMIDVVNEAHPRHAPAPFKNALGGDGATGFDWIIKSFQMARQKWPNAILIYNDYNNCEYNDEVNWTVKLIEAMKKANAPIDAIGCQAHDAYKLSTSTVKGNIDKLAATGLPIFITEYDIGESNDANQEKIMKEQFTMFWNHPKIVGITYWGYVVGSTWRTGTGLLNTNGTERPALAWLKDFVENNPNPPNDFPDLLGYGDPKYNLTVNTMGQGVVIISPDSNSYSKDAKVTVTAKPSDDWVFDSWSSGATGNQNPLIITMNKSTEIVANFKTKDGKSDLVTNGNFSSDANSWTFNSWGGQGSGSVENGEYKLIVTSVGENYYDLQVVQPGILLEKGKTYRLIYDARSSADRILNVNVGMPESPYTSFLKNIINGKNEVNLTTTKQNFILDFTMEDDTYENSRIEFSVATSTPTVFVDNVSLFEIEHSVALNPVQNKITNHINISQNGSLVNFAFNANGNNNANINIYDLLGNVVYSATMKTHSGSTHNFNFNTAGMPNGYYIVKFRSGSSVQKSALVLTGR